MVYTVTFNPALDYVMNVEKLSTDDINRTESEELYYGGKGINVSAILSRLNIPTVALGFTAGFTGKKLKEMLDDDGIKNDFTELNSGFTRINVKVKFGKELDINANGPEITADKIKELFLKLKKLNDGDYLVLAGSVPASLPDDLYSKILEELSGKNINIVVDTTGNQLLNVLKYKPFLIKPNHHELGEIFDQEMDTTEKITEYAKKLQEMGAVNVLVSRGGDGAGCVRSGTDFVQLFYSALFCRPYINGKQAASLMLPVYRFIPYSQRSFLISIFLCLSAMNSGSTFLRVSYAMLSTFVRFLRWMASNLHLVVQTPQPRHLLGSMTDTPQPRQRAVSFLSCSSVKV